MVTVHSAINPRAASGLRALAASVPSSVTILTFLGSTVIYFSGKPAILLGSKMTPTASTPVQHVHKPFTRGQSIGLVFCCTVLGAAAQILMKIGANNLVHPGLMGMMTNLPLMAGYCLYGLSTVL